MALADRCAKSDEDTMLASRSAHVAPVAARTMIIGRSGAFSCPWGLAMPPCKRATGVRRLASMAEPSVTRTGFGLRCAARAWIGAANDGAQPLA